MNKYEEEYSQEILKLKIQNEKLEESYKKYQEKLEKALLEKSKNVEIIKNQILRKQNGLNNIYNELENIRVGNLDTEEEKLNIYNNFYNQLRQVIDNDKKFYYHGCRDLSLVKQIIESKKIVSGYDRTGVETSFDASGTISVTTINSLNVTIQGYAGLQNPSYLPAGAIFVIRPDSAYDENSITTSNVNFEDGNRLVAVITTTENVNKIKEYLFINGFDESICYSYDEFLYKVNSIKSIPQSQTYMPEGKKMGFVKVWLLVLITTIVSFGIVILGIFTMK